MCIDDLLIAVEQLAAAIEKAMKEGADLCCPSQCDDLEKALRKYREARNAL